MSVQKTTYCMFCWDLPYIKGEDLHKAIPGITDEYGNGLKNKENIVIVSDGMNGKYTRIGIVLGESSEDEESDEKKYAANQMGGIARQLFEALEQYHDFDHFHNLFRKYNIAQPAKFHLMFFDHYS